MLIAGSRVRFQQRCRYSLFHGAGEHMHVPRLDVRTTRREPGHAQNFLDDLSRDQPVRELAAGKTTCDHLVDTAAPDTGNHASPITASSRADIHLPPSV